MQAIQIASERALAYSNLAAVDEAEGKLDQALANYQHATKGEPDAAPIAYAKVSAVRRKQADYANTIEAKEAGYRKRRSCLESNCT